MPQTSFQLDDGTAKAIDELKEIFGVTTSTAVIRKAVALARIAARARNTEDQTVTILDQDKTPTKISLTG